ncbi:hypothetical protein C7T94_17980 [Pedobacter yulinensis]|uniref:DUF4836 domain-containing protein n=1 Tax=Pedobacter yulinensis TaxID=2126353 RepID=A0A2T3HH49_9SPHI|nr:hypothetical protein [Pedobacter yulinensis]PST81760.1 hypothetical protein C7T94_17980 [Pedobacter yulinensis]
MKKTFLLTALLLGTGLAYAQELMTRIPAQANAVATFRTGHFFDLISVDEFNGSVLGKAAFSKSANDPSKPKTVSDLGVDLAADAFYFYTTTDSVGYHCVWLPLKDQAKFESLLGKGNIQRQASSSRLTAADSSTVITWNEKQALVVSPGLRDDFFAIKANAARHGLKILDYQPPVIVDSVSVTDVAATPPDSADLVITVPPPIAADAAKAATEADKAQQKADDLYNNYTKSYAEQENLKKGLALKWAETEASRLFTANGPGITGDPSFSRSLDRDAVASVWVRNLSHVLAPAFSMLGFRNPAASRSSLSGFKTVTGQLYFDNDQIRLVTAMELDKTLADDYKRIYSRKLNKKFLNYVDSDKALGFFSYAVNTEAYLDVFPGLMKRTVPLYLFGEEAEVADLAADIFSTVVDEKSIGKVIKGDALFVVNDIRQREVKYKSYEYEGDDFDAEPVEKTKTEPSPDFLFMFSSDDHRIFDRLLAMGEKKGVLQREGELFKVIKGSDAVDLYLTIRNNIVFVGSSQAQMQDVAKGTIRLKTSARHRSLLSRNAMSFYFGPKTLSQKLATDAWLRDETVLRFNEVLKGMGNVYLRSGGVRKNTVTAELVAENGGSEKNALAYLFRLISAAAK